LLGFIAQHTGVCIAGTNTVDANLLWPVIHRHGLGQEHHCAFRGTIYRGTGPSSQAPAGGCIDDAPATCLYHDRDHLPRHQENRLYIHRHHPIPIFLAEFNHRSAADDSGVIEQNMNAAKFAQSSFHDALAVGGPGHISVLKNSAASIVDNLASNGLPHRIVQVDYGNRRAFAGEKQSGCAAYA